MLREDAPADAQWMTTQVAEYARSRLIQARADGEAVEENRLFRNLLSSQPLCFNVFGQLAAYREAAAEGAVCPARTSGGRGDGVLVEHAGRVAAAKAAPERVILGHVVRGRCPPYRWS